MAINNQGHLEVTTKETGYNDSQYSIFNCWNKSIRMQLHTFSDIFRRFSVYTTIQNNIWPLITKAI